ncbi:response regulator [Tropicimonas sp.]|uniref:response regulator n=1 Tax=Tropicimonas sp. TaxID=2067044 RepID=UPI003A89E00C
MNSLSEKLAAERRARLAAEHLLELKSQELFRANKALSQHAFNLSGQIVAKREEMRAVRSQAQELKKNNLRTQAELFRAEREAERAEAQMEIAERRLWDSVETIADGFAVFDREDRLIAANSAWLSIFDHSEAIQPGISYLDVLTFAVGEGVFDIGERKPDRWIAEMLDRWDRPSVPETTQQLWDGRYLRLLDRRARDGDMVCVAQDVTAMKEREAELHEARARAEAANRSKSVFLANMSHELRTPMNGVVAMTDLMLEGDLNEEQTLYLRTIRNSGEALLAIINDVLDFTRIEAEKLVLRPEPFDLERMLHEVLTLVVPQARDRSIDLHVDYDLFLPTRLTGDPGRLRQVLTNLIGNAVKFTMQGHVLVRVVGMELERETWQIHVTVEDTGIGIATDQQTRIFDSFAQVEQDKNRKFEGTGLGLAICREIVDLMSGEIWVESEPAKGSCFGISVTLPCADGGAPAPRALAPGQIRAMMAGGGGLDQDILSKQLRQLGMEVRCLGTGAEALAAIRSGPAPQIVLIDERLPDTSGRKLARDMRAGGLHSATVLLCADPHSARTSSAAPAVDATLVRPVLRSDLFRTLDKIAAAHPRPGAGRTDERTETGPESGQNAPDVPADSAEAPPLSTTGKRRMRVLAAEDNRTNQLVFRKLVKTLDIELAVAGNGHEAVELFASFHPDLVFMDISMPELDGTEATRMIRATERGSRVPIVAMTAHALSGDREEILSAGLDQYLTKPLRKGPVIERILAHCPDDCRLPGEAPSPGRQSGGR